ncbi:hypothetical protein EIN_467930 [Entamoeba invadens IP1]|uniref:TLDc domain-containing protein n=1 Tax=Entamoeba invadens IP1 TaxID=370355 RepID=A0A0A1TUI1_ENTIV|nr:hypothetical protein EIN_467930 [Entamoeba invadens IP1]ELP83679.1 hypothetical protein EIN_467930 [Entamoeba invadens IP1]|eukprot:XP_004183025.1 hypothetical protein EIN_467930 [Entamoeba invadens IP1]
MESEVIQLKSQIDKLKTIVYAVCEKYADLETRVNDTASRQDTTEINLKNISSDFYTNRVLFPEKRTNPELCPTKTKPLQTPPLLLPQSFDLNKSFSQLPDSETSEVFNKSSSLLSMRVPLMNVPVNFDITVSVSSNSPPTLSGPNVYFIDSMASEGVTATMFCKLHEWCGASSYHLYFDSRIGPIEDDTLNKAVGVDWDKTAKQTKKRVLYLFVTSDGYVFGTTHRRVGKTEDSTTKVVMDDADSFIFSLINPTKTAMKVIPKYTLTTDLYQNNHNYFINCAFSLKRNETKELEGMFSTNFSTYFKTEKVVQHGEDAYFLMNSPNKFIVKRVIIFYYEK